MFIAININHQNVILGMIMKIPFNRVIFRVWNLKYKSLTSRNKADEDSPWAIIIIIAPINLIVFNVNSLVRTNPICATDEYAISDFKSFWRMQFILVIEAPINLILIIQ